VPALYGEAFGLYVIEAMASGVPVVQPRHAAFPETVQATGGGSLYEPGELKSLVDAIDLLLTNRILAQSLAENGRKAVLERYGIERMTANTLDVFREALEIP
jgi:glycosyltransferase involved in cell wall biosynthesis